MTKEGLKNLKKNVRKNLFNRNLFFPCMIIVLKYVMQLMLIALFMLLFSSFADFTFIEKFIPRLISQVKNSYKPLFIIFLSPIVFLMYFFIYFFKLGIKRWFYLLSKDKTTSVLEVFYYYREKSKMLSAVKLKLLLILKLMVDALILLVPVVLGFIFLSIQMQTCTQKNKLLYAFLMLISMIIFLINMLYFIKRIFICSLYKVIFFKCGVQNFFKDIKKIKFILKKNKLDFFKILLFSFYCFLSYILIFPALIAVPYYYMNLYAYTDEIIKNNKETMIEPKYKLFYVDINKDLNV